MPDKPDQQNNNFHFWYCEYCDHRNQYKFRKGADGKIVSFCEERQEYLSIFSWCNVGKFKKKAIRDGRPQQLGYTGTGGNE